jgi:hypothetical protein
MKRKRPITKSLAAAVLLIGCSTVLGLEDGTTQSVCETDDDCAPGYSCWSSTCSNTCGADDDCGAGDRCLRLLTGAACVSLDAGCVGGEGGCPEGTRCDSETSACFTTCSYDYDCVEGQSCENSLCRSDDASRDPKAT